MVVLALGVVCLAAVAARPRLLLGLRGTPVLDLGGVSADADLLRPAGLLVAEWLEVRLGALWHMTTPSCVCVATI